MEVPSEPQEIEAAVLVQLDKLTASLELDRGELHSSEAEGLQLIEHLIDSVRSVRAGVSEPGDRR